MEVRVLVSENSYTQTEAMISRFEKDSSELAAAWERNKKMESSEGIEKLSA